MFLVSVQHNINPFLPLGNWVSECSLWPLKGCTLEHRHCLIESISILVSRCVLDIWLDVKMIIAIIMNHLQSQVCRNMAGSLLETFKTLADFHTGSFGLACVWTGWLACNNGKSVADFLYLSDYLTWLAIIRLHAVCCEWEVWILHMGKGSVYLWPWSNSAGDDSLGISEISL